MKNAKISIRPADIGSIKYSNQFKVKPGEQLNLSIKTGAVVKMNPAAPTSAVVVYKFSAKTEDETLVADIETLTAVSASTYIDDLENVIKRNYMNIILLNANEKVRAIFTTVGLNINLPSYSFSYNEENEDNNDDSLDDILNFNSKK